MGFTIEKIGLLLFISAVVAMMSRKSRIPYSVGLVITGGGLAFFPFTSNMMLTKEVLFSTLLPPLIFEAALFLPWYQLREEFPVIGMMATLGVIMAAILTAVGMHYLATWPWISATVFGVLIAATDPVSVIATFKEAGVKGRLRILVEAESLFNDGTAAVLLGVVVVLASGHAPTVSSVAMNIVLTIGGGIVSGAMIAGVALFLSGKAHDHLIEITFTTIAAYGAFLFAEHFHMSGVLATLTAGLILGNTDLIGGMTEKGREAVEAFWEYAAFVANSLIFLFIGIQEAQQHFSTLLLPAGIAIVLVILGRAVAIYPICFLFKRSSLSVSYTHQHILFWGGLRGALALALALGLPPSIPFKNEIETVAFAVVAFSIVVQGITMHPLLLKLGELTHYKESKTLA